MAVKVNPLAARVGGFNALLNPVNAVQPGFHVRIPEGLEECPVTAIHGVDGDGVAAIEVGPRFEQPFRVTAANAVIRQRLLAEIGHPALQYARRFALHLVAQLIWAFIPPFDAGFFANDADFL